MAKKFDRKMEPITGPDQLAAAIASAGTGFIGTYMMELVDSFECFSTKDKKNQYMDYFYNDHFAGRGTKKDLLEKVNTAIRIIESGLVKEAMEYVIAACSDDAGCPAPEAKAAKAGAKELLESLASGAVKLPEFRR